MPERNPCIDSGCRGLCCENMDVEMTKFERRSIFPHAKRVGNLRELAAVKTANLPGVFYTSYKRGGLHSSGFIIAAINGPCPNRTPDGGCLIHEEREHAARNFKLGCEECNAIRKEHGLPPIFLESVE